MSLADRLSELSMVPALSRELESQIDEGGLQIGTTSTTAMAGNRVPTATIRGGVTLQPAVPDLAGEADLETTVTKVNAILAALRAAGIVTA